LGRKKKNEGNATIENHKKNENIMQNENWEKTQKKTEK